MSPASVLSAPLIIVSGHYGAGKTNVSVALALDLKAAGKDVTLVDIDTVNPYFRAADCEKMLSEKGVHCINPEFANSNVDIPSLKADITSVFVNAENNKNAVAIFDVGGDNGAAALGQYKTLFDKFGYEMLFVISKYRPLTETPELALENLKEVEYYARLKCTGIVNNSNLGAETTLETIEKSFDYADKMSKISGLPLIFTSVVKSDFSSELESKYSDKKLFFIENTTRKLF